MQQDRQLVQACRQGQIEAYSTLVNRYRYQVYGICLGSMRDVDMAQDAAQDTFITAFLKLPSLSNPGQFGPWLRRIAINTCRQWHRRQRPMVPIENAENTTWADPTPLPDERISTDETRGQVLDAMASTILARSADPARSIASATKRVAV